MRIRIGFITVFAAGWAAALSALPQPASAINDGGVLLVHTNNHVVYTGDAGYDSGLDLGGSDCDAQLLSLVPTSTLGAAPVVWWVFLAFPENVTISARGVTFGHTWTENLHLLEFTYDEENMLAVTDTEWLTQPGTDIGMGFAWSHTERLIELYRMTGMVTGGSATYGLIPHPVHGGLVGTNDRVFTSLLDYGSVGFNGAAGFNPLPISPDLQAQLGYGRPALELVTKSLILSPEGRRYVGEIELHNTASDERAVLDWQLPWAFHPEGRAGTCTFGLEATPREGRLHIGESVRIHVEWTAGYVGEIADCGVEILTNDPANASVSLPVETSFEHDPDWMAQHGMPVTASVRVLSGNPIRGNAHLGLAVPQPGDARFDIHDAMGRRIWSYEGRLPAGRHELIWPVDETVAAGAYWGVLRGGRGVESTHRLVVLR